MIQLEDRYLGAMVGLAVGDALGTTVEFKPRGSFEPVTDMVGGGPFGLQPGEWTDDTSMALCLAESLVESGGFDARDQMERYVRWWKEGYLSSNGRCFDIGGTTRTALAKFVRSGDPLSGPTDPYSAGNGSLMRLAPVPFFFAADPRRAIHLAGESSRTTHGAAAAIDACRYLGALLIECLQGRSKEDILEPSFTPVEDLWDEEPLAPEIDAIAAGSFKRKSCDDIRSTGYVVHTLEAVLWAFHTTDTFEDGVLAAVNLGDDADTVGAIYGQIAGAYYGLRGIPERWANKIAKGDLILQLAERLYDSCREWSRVDAVRTPHDRHPFVALCDLASKENWCWRLYCTTCGNGALRNGLAAIARGYHPDDESWSQAPSCGMIGDVDWDVSRQKALQAVVAAASLDEIAQTARFPDWLGYLGVVLYFTADAEYGNRMLTRTLKPQLDRMAGQEGEARSHEELLTWHKLESYERELIAGTPGG